MAKNNVGKKPISQEEYTTNKVLAVFSVCLLGVLVLMILERLLGYSNTWKTGVLVTRVLLGVGIVGAAAGIIMLGQEHAGKRSSVRRIVCGRNMLIASVVAIVFLTAINYYGTMPIKAMYVVLPVLAVYYLVYHSYAPEFFLIAVDTGVGVAAMLVIHRALVSANHTWMSTVAAAGTAVLALIQIAVITSSTFPLTAELFNPNIYATGSFDENTHTLVTGQYGFGGWWYDNGIDLSEYKYVVAKMGNDNSDNGASFRLFDENNYWSGVFVKFVGIQVKMLM